jgi:hypothetical protein
VALAASEDPVELAVRAAWVVSEDRVVPAVRAALVVPEDPVVPAVRAALVVSESPAVPVVRAALVVSESPAVPAVLALELDPVAVPELELGRVVALELVLVQVAVALRTRSVIAAHRPDLVPLLEAEEDLAAAVAETTHEPVAAEAVAAWAAAE